MDEDDGQSFEAQAQLEERRRAEEYNAMILRARNVQRDFKETLADWNAWNIDYHKRMAELWKH